MKIKCQNCGKAFETSKKNRKWCFNCNIKAMFGGLTKELNKAAKKELSK